MASGVNAGDEEYLIGSDSADEIYNPVVLKTLKSGIDMVTSIAFGTVKDFDGHFALLCYSNSHLAMFSYNGDLKKNVSLRGLFKSGKKYCIRDISSYDCHHQIFITADCVNCGGSNLHLYNENFDKIEHFGDSSVINDASPKNKTGHIITGICFISPFNSQDITKNTWYLTNPWYTDKLTICFVDALSYELTSNSRRYAMEVKILLHYGTSQLGSRYFNQEASYSSVCPNTLIEFKDEKKKQRHFTFPKRIRLSDTWIIDRKSPCSGDVKVFQKRDDAPPVLKFVYRGNPCTTFDPMDLEASQDIMVISDCSNHNVHLVKNDGTFLMHVMTGSQGLQYPRALCVDFFDRIWVGCNDGTVHILKFRDEFEA